MGAWGSTTYALCIYDQSGGGTRVLDANAPNAGFCKPFEEPCWKETGSSTSPTGLRYRRPFGAPDGLTTLRMKSGGTGAASALVLGKGSALDVPTLPLVAPVTKFDAAA